MLGTQNIKETGRKVSEIYTLDKVDSLFGARNSREWFRVLFSEAPVAMCLFDEEGRFVEINHRAETISGYEKKNIIGKKFTEAGLVLPDDLPRAIEEFKKQLHSEEAMTQVVTMRCRDGRRCELECHSRRLDFANNKLVLLVARDNTEKKKAQKELQSLTTILKFSNEIVCLSRLDGKVLSVNEWGAKRVGIDLDQVTLLNLIDVIPAHLVGKVRDELLPQLRARGNWEGELQYTNLTTGELIDVHVMAFVIMDQATGTPLYLASIAVDIGERKKAEKALEKSAMLLQEQKKALEEKNIALREIISTIETEKHNLKKLIVAHAERLLMPMLKKLSRRATSLDKKYIGFLESGIRDLTSSFGVKITNNNFRLTLREVEICNLIRNGSNNKEIARFLNISLRTVELHRNHIRRKLHLNQKDINLASFLRSQ